MATASAGDPEFKMDNQASWQANTDYWLNNPLRHVEDTKAFFNEKLKDLVKPGSSVVDMGCGSGWILEFLLNQGIRCEYKGLDFTAEFITYLKDKYADVEGASFEQMDLEESIPVRLHKTADVVFSAFALFEMTALDVAFTNAVEMLRDHGQFVILTIDPTYLALAVSKDMAAFKATLQQYEEMKGGGDVLRFFQNIDLGDAESKELKYASVLYSFGDFYGHAKKHGMHLADYAEVVKTSKFLPKIYQYIVFEK